MVNTVCLASNGRRCRIAGLVRALRLAGGGSNRFLKWGGVGLAAVLVVAVSSVCRAHDRRPGQAACPPALRFPTSRVEATPERIARGKALVDGFCSACHSRTGTLTGGLDIGDDFPIPIGSFVSSNLTPAGRLKQLVGTARSFARFATVVDAKRALADTHVLHQRRQFERRRYPGGDRVHPQRASRPASQLRNRRAQLNMLGVLMLGAGHAAERQAGHHRQHYGAHRRVRTFAFGEYILSYQDCRECHGPSFDRRRAGADRAART